MSYFKSFILDTDNISGDAFGRLRTSTPTTIFDSKQIFNNQSLQWDDQQTSGAGTTSTWTASAASSVMAISATTAGTRVRQTFRRFNYFPGKSQLVLATGVLAKSGGGTGITRRFGLFDENNGFFLADEQGHNMEFQKELLHIQEDYPHNLYHKVHGMLIHLMELVPLELQ